MQEGVAALVARLIRHEIGVSRCSELAAHWVVWRRRIPGEYLDYLQEEASDGLTDDGRTIVQQNGGFL